MPKTLHSRVLLRSAPSPFLSCWGRLLAVLALLLGGSTGAWAQLTGTKTIATTGGDYTSVANAIAALNAQGVGANGVTFNVPAGWQETFASPTAGRITVNSTAPTTGPTSPTSGTNPIVFQKLGTGANPLITGGVGTSASDAIISVVGTDNITFTSIDVSDNSANTSAAAQMEYGYALFRASATDGSQYVSITGSTITLNKANTNTTVAIRSASTDATGTTVTATNATGTNSYTKVNGVTVANAFTGVYVSGTSANYPDTGDEVGSTTGNTMTNLGGSNTALYGIRGEFMQNLKIENNTVTIPAGNTSTTIYGIGVGSGTAAGIVGTVLLNNNTVSITSATTSAVIGILQGGSSAITTSTITNNKVQNSTLTGASGTVYYIQDASTSAATSVTMTGNQVTGNTAATTGTVYCLYKSASGTALTATNNTVSNNTKSGAGTLAGFYANSTITTLTVSNNTFSGNQITAASGSLYGIDLGSSTTNSVLTMNGNTITNNTIPNTSGTTASVNVGIYSFGAVNTSETETGNTITGLSIGGAATSACTLRGVYLYNSATPKTISQNTIGNLTIGASGTAVTGTTSGIYLDSSTGSTVALSQNKLYGLSAYGTAGVVYGVYLTVATTPTISNNLIGNLTAPASTNAQGVTGLYIAGGTTVNAYYNTIYLAGTSSGSGFGTAGIYASTTPTLTLIDNIVVNASIATGTGVAAAYQRSNTTLTTYGSSSNNNLFYTTASPTTTRPIFYDGSSNDYSTLAKYKALVTSRDNASITENPPFLSTTGTDATYLHINPSTATQIESGGVAISGITTDYDGDTRNATTPDIGADEGTFTLQDLTPPAITYTALGNTSSTASRSLAVTITDASGLATGAGAPRIYYKLSTASTYFSAVATNVSGSTYTFTIDYANIGGTPAGGTTIQYYVAAQDASTNNNTATSPTGGAGTNPPGSSAPTTPNSYQILATLAGDYYVMGTATAGTSPGGATREYATLTAAAADYNTKGLTGAVRFWLFSNTQGTETYPINFGTNPDASSTNTLTIKPYTGVTTTFTNSTTNSTFKTTSGSYIIFDGSNTSGGTTRDVTLSNTSTTATAAALVWVASTTTAPSNSVQVLNLNLQGAANGSGNTSTGVMVSNTTYNASTGANANGIVIRNNSIQGVSLGIVEGNDSAAPGTGLQVVNNVVGPATANSATNINIYGIFTAYVTSPTITGNMVQNVVSSSANNYGIYTTYATSPTITGNTVQNVAYTAGAAYGINATTGTTGGSISNNTINGVSGTGATAGTFYALGIASSATNGTISGNTLTNITTTNAGTATGVYLRSAATSVTLSNNTISNITAPGTSTANATYGLNVVGGSSSSTGNVVSNLSAAYGPAVGIFLGPGSAGTSAAATTVSRNKIFTLTSTATGGSAGVGILVATQSGAGTSAYLTLSNNFVADLHGTSNTSISGGSIVGILLNGSTAQSGISLYYNSVYLSGTYTPGTTTTGLLTAALGVTTGNTGLDLRNNIFENVLTSTSGTGKSYAYYNGTAGGTYTSSTYTGNYNDYYTTGTQAVLAYFSGADVSTLAALQNATTGTGQDANSVNADASFTSATDLHAAAAAVNNVGTPIASVTTDIDGDPRSATTPDIGADEFTPAQTLDLKPTVLLAPAAGAVCYSSTEAVTVTVLNNGGAAIDFGATNGTITVVVTPPAGGAQTFTTTLTTGTLASGATQTVTLPGTLNMTASGTYSFVLSASVPGDVNTADNVTVTRTNSAGLALPYAENFNASTTLPTGYTVDTGSSLDFAVRPSHGTGTTASNGLSANVYGGSSANLTSFATTPIVGNTPYASNQLTFAARFVEYNSYPGTATTLAAGDKLEVQVSVCGGAFTTVYTINSTNYNGTGTASTSFYTYTVPLTGVGSGQRFQIRFFATTARSDAAGYYVDLDDLNVQSLAPIDLAPTALAAPTTTQGCYGATEAVTVTVKNQGASVLDFSQNPATVTVGVTGAATATLTGALTSGTLAVGATQNVTLTGGGPASNGTLNMTAYGTYTFAVSATATGDGNTANDNLATSPAITTAAPVAGTVSPATTTLCQSGTTTLTLAGAANGTIQWQTSTDNVTFSDVAGANAATYLTPTLTTTTYYRAQVRCSGNVVTSNLATITVNSPQAPTVTSPVTRCGSGAVTLTATPSTGATINWYTNSTTTTVLATGNTYSPSVTATRTYYAASAISTCISARTVVQVNVTTPPTLTPATQTATICAGSSTSIAYANYANLTVSPTTGATVSGTTVTFSPTATTTYTVTGNDGTGATGCTSTATATITVNSAPTAPTLTPAAASICAGTSTTATATATSSGTATTTALSQNFNSGLGSWTATNNGGAATTVWSIATPPYSYTGVNGTTYLTNWNGADGTPLAFANSDIGGSNSTTNTLLTSPSFSTLGATAGTVKFDQLLRSPSTATVEYSTDNGTTWTVLATYSSSIGTNPSSTTPSTVNTAVPLVAGMLNQTNLRLRFHYVDTYGYYWAIDNVAVTLTAPESPTYAVVGNPATATVSGSTITFNPTTTTTYNVVATYPSSGCPSPAAPITITVNTATAWTGTTSADWFTSTNWTNCVPTRFTDATIPTGAPNYPSLSTAATAEVRSLTLDNGASLTQSAGALNVYGNLTSNTPAANVTLTGMVAFLGTTPQVSGMANFYDLNVNLSTAGNTLTMAGSTSVAHALTLTQGLLSTGANTLTLPAGATIAETDASYVLGNVSATGRTLAAGTAESFGGIGLTLTPAAGSTSPGLTPVVRTTGTVLTGVGTGQSIQRYYDIQPAVNTGLNVTMAFSYFDHERNGIAANTMQLFKSTTGTSGPWAQQAPSSSSGNTVTAAGISDFSTWTLGGGASPLPVTLTRFDAARQGQDAALSWSTSSEVSNAGFEVQVSADGQTFRKLGFVAPATATSTTAHTYAFLDQEASKTGLRYYRLRQLDLDGSAHFSPVRTVAFDAPATVELSAMPNPFQQSLVLRLTLPTASTATLTLTDALGRVVRTQALGQLAAGTSQPTLDDLGSLPAGLYVLRLSLPGGTHTLKVVKE